MTKKQETFRDKLNSIPTNVPERLSTPAVSRPARTGPGALGEFMVRESQTFAENERLSAENAALKSAQPPTKLSPQLIVASQYANRSEDSFKGPEFETLLDEIRNAGGNIQPIKVRPLKNEPGEQQLYEIVFGHRRHRACLLSNNDVLVIVENMDDQSLFEQMDRENRNRADLRPYEQGLMYRRALENNLFKNLHQLCLVTGANSGNSSLVVRLANLSPDFLCGFKSPLEVQFRWIAPLLKAIESRPNLVLQRGQAFAQARQEGVGKTAAEVFTALIGESPIDEAANLGKPQELYRNGRATVVLKKTKTGDTISFSKDVLTHEREQKLRQFLESILQ